VHVGSGLCVCLIFACYSGCCVFPFSCFAPKRESCGWWLGAGIVIVGAGMCVLDCRSI